MFYLVFAKVAGIALEKQNPSKNAGVYQ